MLTIKIPNNFQPERQYIIDVIFGHFFAVDYTVQTAGCSVSEINTARGTLVLNDSFFAAAAGAYIKREYLPEVKYYRGNFIPEPDLPVLYGEPEIIVRDKYIDCRIDIFAAVFFMLARWEECLPAPKDIYGRFPATKSVAWQNDFLRRPVVAEWLELLWNLLQRIAPELRRKENKFQLYMTHDVDKLEKWPETSLPKELLRAVLGRAEQNAWSVLLSFWQAKKDITKDPFYTFPLLKDSLLKYNQVKAVFYFIAGGHTQYERFYDIQSEKIKNLLLFLENERVEFGLHPSYVTFDNAALLSDELACLEQVIGKKIRESRQHYLRFAAPATWRHLAQCGIEIDSSGMYADKEGFRFGTGAVFPVFDVEQRKILPLLERPLLYMDQRDYECGGYQGTAQNGAEIFEIIRYCRKYKTDCTVLFHNNVLESAEYKKTYFEVLKCAE
ncbi:carbohydrate esterase 4 superfamily [Candidatus Termititenax aidoneus]|uniref:Carbohydrate esterase 4 superfamily n=1 Tax=Termititenax aidoneus TaxID=2218524 RepID=A0A388TB59_TERA1|nr:carbohydrate esterase 4 superfamily [Candidatus Termititenax aidoneus]